MRRAPFPLPASADEPPGLNPLSCSFRRARSWEAFRFVLHFLGDVHQPMHLTSRERGGNGDFVLWEGRRSNLHSVWDGLLIARALREQHNYTTPLPS